jgi:hypothetical protein
VAKGGSGPGIEENSILVTGALSNINEGRLTVVSGQPNPVDVTGGGDPIQVGTGQNSATLYYTPYVGNKVLLYFGGHWSIFTTAEISISNAGLGDGLDPSVGPYDVFLFGDGLGNVHLEFGPAYAQFTRPAGRLMRQDGILVKNGDPTRKFIGTICTVAVGNHVAPFLFWDGSNVRFVSNFYNKIMKYMWGEQGYQTGALRTKALNAAAAGQWQIPLFLGLSISDYTYPGHIAPIGSGDPIYVQWVACEARNVRLAPSALMALSGGTRMGFGVGLNQGDDPYDPTQVIKSCQTDLTEISDSVETQFLCPPGVFTAWMAFFADGGTFNANFFPNDVARGAAASPYLTYLHGEIEV